MNQEEEDHLRKVEAWNKAMSVPWWRTIIPVITGCYIPILVVFLGMGGCVYMSCKGINLLMKGNDNDTNQNEKISETVVQKTNP